MKKKMKQKKMMKKSIELKGGLMNEQTSEQIVPEQRIIKLTPEQIEERQIQLERTQMNIEMSELNIKHMERAIESNMPIREAKLQLSKIKQNLETFRHNVIALTEQITKGEV